MIWSRLYNYQKISVQIPKTNNTGNEKIDWERETNWSQSASDRDLDTYTCLDGLWNQKIQFLISLEEGREGRVNQII